MKKLKNTKNGITKEIIVKHLAPGIMVVAVVSTPEQIGTWNHSLEQSSWAAYIGISRTDWKCILEYGTKLDPIVAKAIFPEISKKGIKYRR
jgi:hypothetical protein